MQTHFPHKHSKMLLGIMLTLTVLTSLMVKSIDSTLDQRIITFIKATYTPLSLVITLTDATKAIMVQSLKLMFILASVKVKGTLKCQTYSLLVPLIGLLISGVIKATSLSRLLRAPKNMYSMYSGVLLILVYLEVLMLKATLMSGILTETQMLLLLEKESTRRRLHLFLLTALNGVEMEDAQLQETPKAIFL